MGKYSQAIKCAKRAIQIDAECPASWFHLGRAHKFLDNYEEAKESLNKAISFRGPYPEAWFELGEIFNLENKPVDAIHAFHKAIQLSSSISDINEANKQIKKIVTSHHETINLNKLLKEAITLNVPATVALVLAYKADPFNSDYYQQKTAFHMAAKLNHSECLVHLLNQYPESINVRDDFNQTPLALAAYNSQEECVELLLKRGADATACDVDGNNAIHHASSFYYKKNSYKTISCLKLLIKAEGDLIKPNKFGKTPLDLAKEGNHDFEEVTSFIENRLVNEYCNQSDKLSNAGNHDAALNELEKGLTVQPNNSTLLNNAAFECNQLGKYDKAKNYAKRAIKSDKYFANPRRHLGNAYFGLQDYQNAKECFEKAIELKPDYAEAKRDLNRCQNKINEIEMLEKIRNHIKANIWDYQDKTADKLSFFTFFGHTFFYNPELSKEKEKNGNQLISDLDRKHSHGAIKTLLQEHITMDKEVTDDYGENPGTLIELLKKLINNVDQIKNGVDLPHPERKLKF